MRDEERSGGEGDESGWVGPNGANRAMGPLPTPTHARAQYLRGFANCPPAATALPRGASPLRIHPMQCRVPPDSTPFPALSQSRPLHAEWRQKTASAWQGPDCKKRLRLVSFNHPHTFSSVCGVRCSALMSMALYADCDWPNLTPNPRIWPRYPIPVGSTAYQSD